jgi:hypothetical protein
LSNEVHDRMLKQARIPVDDGEIGCHFNHQSNAGFGEAMFDERHRPGDQGRWLNRFGGGPIAAGKPKQSANDSVNAVNLFKNDANASRRPFVTSRVWGPAAQPGRR